MLTAEEFRENNRKVAEVAWDEGFDVGANTEEGIDTNPYRAKGATND